MINDAQVYDNTYYWHFREHELMLFPMGAPYDRPFISHHTCISHGKITASGHRYPPALIGPILVGEWPKMSILAFPEHNLCYVV